MFDPTSMDPPWKNTMTGLLEALLPAWRASGSFNDPVAFAKMV